MKTRDETFEEDKGKRDQFMDEKIREIYLK